MRTALLAVQLIIVCLTFAMATSAFAEQPPAPTAVHAQDRPWDHGTEVDLRWEHPEAEPGTIKRFVIYQLRTLSEQERAAIRTRLAYVRHEARNAGVPESEIEAKYQEAVQSEIKQKEPTEPVEVASVPGDVRSHRIGKLEPGGQYSFTVRAESADGVLSQPSAPVAVSPSTQPFDGRRGWLAVMVAFICAAVIVFIVLARRGMPMTIRKIAGLAAVEEAVGRATEMGRPVLFVPGLQDMNDMMTLAGLTALSRVSKIAAEYDAKLEVPTCRSLVMTAARETVQTSFLAAGRPDAYNEDSIYYVTDEQFGYVAYLTGYMSRQKPAACFYMGVFYAESLMLAEIGNSIGAIQIAGTAETAQLPFFVAACDYTLIGEEFYAASAYLSGEPDQLGSLKGQDVGKIIAATLILIGCAVATLAVFSPQGSAIHDVLSYLKQRMLSA